MLVMERLCEAALNVFVGNKNIAEISEMPIEESLEFFKKLKLDGKKRKISEKLVAEIVSKIRFF